MFTNHFSFFLKMAIRVYLFIRRTADQPFGHFNSIHLQISITALTSFMLDAPSIAATQWHAPRAAWGMRNNKACCHCGGGDLVARNQDHAQPIWDTYNVMVSYISGYTLFAYR